MKYVIQFNVIYFSKQYAHKH